MTASINVLQKSLIRDCSVRNDYLISWMISADALVPENQRSFSKLKLLRSFSFFCSTCEVVIFNFCQVIDSWRFSFLSFSGKKDFGKDAESSSNRQDCHRRSGLLLLLWTCSDEADDQTLARFDRTRNR